ncbi:MAG: mandelate racemase/muconate lactonizing enzyme family protein [Candidatus Hodarchaeota archaeon]
MRTTTSILERRRFLKTTGVILAGIVSLYKATEGQEAQKKQFTIKDLRITQGVTVEANDGMEGSFKGSGAQDLKTLQKHLVKIKELLVGKNPFNPTLEGELLWEAIYPGKAKLFAQGRDPLTGEIIVNKPRDGRHTKTGRVFMAFSTVDIALWDLRGKLLKKPSYQIIGKANRRQVPVYWRPGEADRGLEDARQRARKAYDKGYHYQKWYFTKSAKDGDKGLKENVELVRILREELPDAKLMFDNHSIRYHADVDYSVKLCKAVASYKPFWIEEPICPEHLDGYARIKEETGVTIAGGEHWHTRWQVKPFLERKCVDYVQSDPVWCGGISEWLKVCELVRQHPGVKVVPHITSPWIAAPHCVASQPEDLCPLLEFNYEGGRKALEKQMCHSRENEMLYTMPDRPGIS